MVNDAGGNVGATAASRFTGASWQCGTRSRAATHTITLTATADQGGPATDTMVVTEKVKGGGKGAGNSTAAR